MVAIIQEGYKSSELGIIPKSWEIQSVGDVVSIKTGSRNTQDKDSDGIYPFFVRSQNVEAITSYGFDCEAVLTAGDGVGTGKIFHYINGKFDAHQRVYVMSDFSDDIRGKFFYLVFKNGFYDRILQMTAKSSVDSVRREMIANMLLRLPSVIEQTAIAEALTDADEAIQSLEAVIAKKRDVKQATLHALLTPTRRLPGFSGDWRELSLGKCASLKARIGWQGLTTKEYQEEGPCGLITGTDFKDGNIDWSNIVYIEEERYTQDINIQVKLDDVLVTKDGTIGKIAIVKSLPLPTTLNSGVFVIRPKDKSFYPKYLYYILMSEYFEKFLKKLSAGSTINHLYQRDFVEFQIPVPPTIEEQTAIATILSVMDAEIEVLETRLDKLRNIKQGMTQALLTGKVRLI